MTKIRVDVVATSSVVPKIEYQRGLKKLSALGFGYSVAENILLEDFAYAGSASQRAAAFYAAAMSESELIWAVRGGYGASQILVQLEALSKIEKPAKSKILIGYSDLTALYQFVSERWGWKILHAPMLASADFHRMRAEDETALLALIAGKAAGVRYRNSSLNWLHRLASEADEPIVAPLYGGNLAVICSMLGTPWQLNFAGKIVFLEEISESWSKIDRMLQQLLLSGALNECKAIVLGEFSLCADHAPRGRRSEVDDELVAIRQALTTEQAMQRVFSRLGAQLNIPICSGLASGHCAENAPLAILATYQLSVAQGLQFLSWP